MGIGEVTSSKNQRAQLKAELFGDAPASTTPASSLSEFELKRIALELGLSDATSIHFIRPNWSLWAGTTRAATTNPLALSSELPVMAPHSLTQLTTTIRELDTLYRTIPLSALEIERYEDSPWYQTFRTVSDHILRDGDITGYATEALYNLSMDLKFTLALTAKNCALEIWDHDIRNISHYLTETKPTSSPSIGSLLFQHLLTEEEKRLVIGFLTDISDGTVSRQHFESGDGAAVLAILWRLYSIKSMTVGLLVDNTPNDYLIKPRYTTRDGTTYQKMAVLPASSTTPISPLSVLKDTSEAITTLTAFTAYIVAMKKMGITTHQAMKIAFESPLTSAGRIADALSTCGVSVDVRAFDYADSEQLILNTFPAAIARGERAFIRGFLKNGVINWGLEINRQKAVAAAEYDRQHGSPENPSEMAAREEYLDAYVTRIRNELQSDQALDARYRRAEQLIGGDSLLDALTALEKSPSFETFAQRLTNYQKIRTSPDTNIDVVLKHVYALWLTGDSTISDSGYLRWLKEALNDSYPGGVKKTPSSYALASTLFSDADLVIPTDPHLLSAFNKKLEKNANALLKHIQHESLGNQIAMFEAGVLAGLVGMEISTMAGKAFTSLAKQLGWLAEATEVTKYQLLIVRALTAGVPGGGIGVGAGHLLMESAGFVIGAKVPMTGISGLTISDLPKEIGESAATFYALRLIGLGLGKAFGMDKKVDIATVNMEALSRDALRSIQHQIGYMWTPAGMAHEAAQFIATSAYLVESGLMTQTSAGQCKPNSGDCDRVSMYTENMVTLFIIMMKGRSNMIGRQWSDSTWLKANASKLESDIATHMQSTVRLLEDWGTQYRKTGNVSPLERLEALHAVSAPLTQPRAELGYKNIPRAHSDVLGQIPASRTAMLNGHGTKIAASVGQAQLAETAHVVIPEMLKLAKHGTLQSNGDLTVAREKLTDALAIQAALFNQRFGNVVRFELKHRDNDTYSFRFEDPKGHLYLPLIYVTEPDVVIINQYRSSPKSPVTQPTMIENK